jgi:hypothetical protein
LALLGRLLLVFQPDALPVAWTAALPVLNPDAGRNARRKL